MYSPFAAVSENLGGKVQVVDDVSSSHKQEKYSTTSIDENCMEFEFQLDRATTLILDRRTWL